MTNIKGSPEKIKVTPANYPQLNLPKRWQKQYETLTDAGVYNQTEAIDQIAAEHNVSTSTIYRAIFPEKKERYKKRAYRRWDHQTSRPNFSRESYNVRRANYAYFCYHFDEFLEKAFQKSGGEPMELSDLVLRLHDVSGLGLLIRPPTVLGLNQRFEASKGHPLLVEVPASSPENNQPTLYRLNSFPYSKN